MDAQTLLEQLLQSGKTLAQQGLEQGSEIAAQGKSLADQGIEYATDKFDFPEAGPERDQLLKNLGIGAAAGGLLALLVGTQSGRRVLGPALKLGSLAALGGLGYKVYSDWQKGQGLEPTGQPFTELTAAQANQRSLAIVAAMIAAAKADGQIDEEERLLISSKIKESNLESSATEILLTEIPKELKISEVAAAASSPESAIEIYLASLLVTDDANPSERQYLAELATAMGLDAELVKRLEAEAFATP